MRPRPHTAGVPDARAMYGKEARRQAALAQVAPQSYVVPPSLAHGKKGKQKP
mgnify:CR=1 FL=1